MSIQQCVYTIIIAIDKRIVLFLLVQRDKGKKSPPFAWCTGVCTVNNDFAYTGLNIEKYIESANVFINYGRCQPQKFAINECTDIFETFIMTANIEKLVYGFVSLTFSQSIEC